MNVNRCVLCKSVLSCNDNFSNHYGLVRRLGFLGQNHSFKSCIHNIATCISHK